MMEKWIQTFTGKRLNVDNLTNDVIDIEDIAHGLAMECRYSGQCKFFYSVAQHSVLMCDYFYSQHRFDLAFEALMHDAEEYCYLGDVAKPIKVDLPDECQSKMLKIKLAIAKKYNLPLKQSEEIKTIDQRIMMTEKTVLFNNRYKWSTDCNPLNVFILEWDWRRAKEEFLQRFSMLQNL